MVGLRNMRRDDLAFVLRVRNHETTRYYLENDQKFTIKQATAWFKQLNQMWLIILNETGTRVGYVRLKGNMVGVDIHPAFRRRGYAREAYKQVIAATKKDIYLWVFEDNFAINLYYELGFERTGNVTECRGRPYLEMVYRNVREDPAHNSGTETPI